MSHPDLDRILAELDPEDAKAIAHLLTCPDCADKARQSLEDTDAPEPLPARDLAALERFREDMARQREKLERLIRRLRRNKGSRAHFVVRSRLECVMADRLEPAVRELEGILGVGRIGMGEGGEGAVTPDERGRPGKASF